MQQLENICNTSLTDFDFMTHWTKIKIRLNLGPVSHMLTLFLYILHFVLIIAQHKQTLILLQLHRGGDHRRPRLCPWGLEGRAVYTSLQNPVKAPPHQQMLHLHGIQRKGKTVCMFSVNWTLKKPSLYYFLIGF